MWHRHNKGVGGKALLIGTAYADSSGGMMKAGPAILYRVAPATAASNPALAQATNSRSAQRCLRLYLPDDDGSGSSRVCLPSNRGQLCPAPALALRLWKWHNPGPGAIGQGSDRGAA